MKTLNIKLVQKFDETTKLTFECIIQDPADMDFQQVMEKAKKLFERELNGGLWAGVESSIICCKRGHLLNPSPGVPLSCAVCETTLCKIT